MGQIRSNSCYYKHERIRNQSIRRNLGQKCIRNWWYVFFDKLKLIKSLVVDDDGKLVGNISASDLKRAHLVPVGSLGKDLYQPIKTFLNIRGDLHDRVTMGGLPKYEPISVNLDNKFGEIAQLVTEKKVHRVYVVDEDKKPLCVVTLRDLLARILERTAV
jgi:predicted transcriptional regulator